MQTIHIEPAAPPKPSLGEACNGCGVCCLAEPCPLGMLLSRRRSGACAALRWDAHASHYRCGAIVDTAQAWRLPPGLARWFVPPLRALALRWIAAGKGCDSTLVPSAVDPPPERPGSPIPSRNRSA